MIIRFVANVGLAIIILIATSFFYFGINEKTQVSFDYNVPIAQSILSGDFITLTTDNFYAYSPGASHILLAPFLFLGFPNLFGVLGFIFLFIACQKVAEVFGLSKYMAIIFAVAFCTTIAVIRTISDQSIDKWLCVWFLFSVYLLQKPSYTIKQSILLGVSIGMLIGTKYSGPLFFIPLLIVYKDVFLQYLKHLPLLTIVSSIVSLLGLFWYIRNFLITGSPYYPSGIYIFKGYPNFTQQDWMLWKIPILYPEGLIDLYHSFLSEYLIWSFAIVVLFWFCYQQYKKKRSFDKKLIVILQLFVLTSIISLLLPVTPPYKIELFHIVSDMRYLYIPVSLSILAVSMILQSLKKADTLAAITLLNCLQVFSFIPYQPKLFTLTLAAILFLYQKKILFK